MKSKILLPEGYFRAQSKAGKTITLDDLMKELNLLKEDIQLEILNSTIFQNLQFKIDIEEKRFEFMKAKHSCKIKKLYIRAQQFVSYHKHKENSIIKPEIYEFLKSIFLEFGESEILLTPTNANDLFLSRSQSVLDLARIFREDFKAKQYTNNEGKEVVTDYSIPYWSSKGSTEVIVHFHNFKGRPFVFKAEEILDKPDLILWRDQFHNPDAPAIAPPVTLSVAEAQKTIFDQTPDDEIEENLPF